MPIAIWLVKSSGHSQITELKWYPGIAQLKYFVFESAEFWKIILGGVKEKCCNMKGGHHWISTF